jgi:hypothetical protein
MCRSEVKDSVRKLTFIGLWFCTVGVCGVLVNNLFIKSALIEMLVEGTIAVGVLVFCVLGLLSE